MEAELLHVDGRTDGHDEYRNIAKASNRNKVENNIILKLVNDIIAKERRTFSGSRKAFVQRRITSSTGFTAFCY